MNIFFASPWKHRLFSMIHLVAFIASLHKTKLNSLSISLNLLWSRYQYQDSCKYGSWVARKKTGQTLLSSAIIFGSNQQSDVCRAKTSPTHPTNPIYNWEHHNCHTFSHGNEARRVEPIKRSWFQILTFEVGTLIAFVKITWMLSSSFELVLFPTNLSLILAVDNHRQPP